MKASINILVDDDPTLIRDVFTKNGEVDLDVEGPVELGDIREEDGVPILVVQLVGHGGLATGWVQFSPTDIKELVNLARQCGFEGL